MELSVAGSPSCLAELRRAIRSGLAEVPAAIPDEVVDEVVLAVSEAAANAILYGSGAAQPVTVTVRAGGGWVEATIRDRGRGRPAAPGAAPVTGLGGRGCG
jgi:anti-sigma regulatory factor (Ser/Thr protein kinase)